MADDRNNSQGFVGQAHTVEQASSSASSSTASASASGSASGSATVATGSSRSSGGVPRENSPPRGPRTLLLKRSENGFGFTLRHFIVYPPESCCMLPGHERTRIDEPMDTIFVKQVRANSPAAKAGLRTGDRVVSVDGKPTRGEQYASVVQRIQQAGPWLRLLVVPKEDDILQRYFGETAHNPETNQRPRIRSPERNGQRQRRSVSMIPALSPRTRQSWVCTMSSSEGEQRPTDTGYRDSEIPVRTAAENSSLQPLVKSPPPPAAQQHSPNMAQQRRPLQENAALLYDTLEEKPRTKQQQQSSSPQSYGKDSTSQISQRSSVMDSRFDLYDRTRPESIYSQPSSEQIYDRIKDPIYERVRPGESTLPTSEEKQQQQLGLLRFPMSRAEPQVPIYRPGRRVTSRRASEGSGISTSHDSEGGVYGSTDALKSSDAVSRLSMDSRRDSSISRGSPSTYDSSSTLTGNGNGSTHDGRLSSAPVTSNTKGSGSRNGSSSSECIDDSVIMTRLRKSFEQKEEFLRRPSHPIGWFLPEDAVDPSQNSNPSTVIPREFYARPQKLQRQIWPPGEQRQSQSSPTRRSSQEKIASAKLPVIKPTNQSVQRVKTDAGSESECSSSRADSIDEKTIASTLADSPAAARDRFYSSQYEDRSQSSESRFVSHDAPSTKSTSDRQTRSAGKSTFVGTLSRIHENITSAAALLAGDKQSHDSRNGCSSLPSSPGPDKKTNEKFPTLPQGLQIVSKRAKQFESGRLLSDDDEPTGDRTNLYKSELSRLSNKRSVPNVAVRKREFESKAEAQEPRRIPATRETKSLDTGVALSGNRVIPIGSKYIHCEPPPGYRVIEGTTVTDDEIVQPRARSNSVESWETASGSSRKSTTTHPWQLPQDDLDQREDRGDDITTGSIDGGDNEEDTGKRQSSYSQVLGSDAGAHDNGVVYRRQKNVQIGDEDRATRRVSYLKATWGERMHVDSDLDLSDCEPVHTGRSDSTSSGPEPPGTVPATPSTVGPPASRDIEPVEREGCLHIKFTVLDGKRSTDRSWKQVWGVLRGPILYFYKDRHNQSPSVSTDGENSGQFVDVRCSLVDIAEDYTKRKHVLRLANPNAEVLLQTDDAASMALWLRSLHEHAAADKPSDVACSSTSKQQAVPQAPGPTTSSSSNPVVCGSAQRLSPVPGHKGIKKLTSFRNRSPTGQSPVNKTRKPSQTVETLPSPKTKTWKGRVAKQLRRMHGQAGSPSSPTAQLPPEGATFKVPLELCPPSSFSEFVPLIVEMCTSIVEARGLEVIGIYRVPGNTAAISQLTDSVNKGFEQINLQDPRWSDVNVISSLLKSFFRQLPDSLLTAELYPMFIDADKVEDPQRRMTTIRKLLRDLPEHHFETLKYLMFHLKRIVEHSEINKMEAKNLAIVFGPTLVRASGSRDNMVTMVTDMSHQCRIVESLLNNVDWFFSDDDLDDLSRLSVNLSLPADGSEMETASNTNHSLLLNNIQKVEGSREMASARDIVSSIISAANRKIQRRRKGQDETDNDSHHEAEKSKSKQEADNLVAMRRSMALNERQCSVSEIVLMHENKSQSNRSTDRSPTIDGNVGSIGSISNVAKDDTASEGAASNRSKYSKQVNLPMLPIQRSAVSSASESSRLSSETGMSCYDGSSTLSSTSNDTKQSNDEVIRTYAGLSATTQERIRRFEQETRAMLQRDQNRQRREAEKREEEKRRIEMEWQLAKREMENDDLLDSIVDNTVAPNTYLSSGRLSTLDDRLADKSYLDLSEKHLSPRTAARVSPLSIAVQQQPTNGRRMTQHSDESASTLLENLNNAVIKKLKTEKEVDHEPTSLPPVRYGSLDSLHECHDLSQSSISPSQPRKPQPGDISDDGSDLLTSITNTFDRKWRSLVNPIGQGIRGSAGNSSYSGNDDGDDEDEDHDGANGKKRIQHGEDGEDESIGNQRQKDKGSNASSVETYRDPSLHKTWLGKSHLPRQKNDAPEKDTDSSIADSAADKPEGSMPNNDRSAKARKKCKEGDEYPESEQLAGATGERRQDIEKLNSSANKENEESSSKLDMDSSYSNKLQRFERLTNSEVRSRLKRSESLNKRSESAATKLKRSESLNKHSTERLSSPTNGKLKRSESLNKHSERSDSPNSKLKRSESLTKTEKTECNISKRRQSVRKDSATKLKRKNGMPERSIKRRHTVGGTKDFDKVHWLDNKLQSENERAARNDYRPKKSQLRTSSPDLSTGRIGMADASFLIEVSFRGPSNVVFNVTNARPQSLPDASLSSKVFKVPLESHV